MSTIHQAEIIRSAAHRLLDAHMEAQAAFKADCDRANKYDRDSPNLTKSIKIDAAVDALVYTHAAVVNERDAAATLAIYIARENEPHCLPVSAAALLQEVADEITAGVQESETAQSTKPLHEELSAMVVNRRKDVDHNQWRAELERCLTVVRRAFDDKVMP